MAQQPFDPERMKVPETEAEKKDFINRVKESGPETLIVAMIEGEPFISVSSLKGAIGKSYVLGLAQNLDGGELSTYMMNSLKNMILNMDEQLETMCRDCTNRDKCDGKNCSEKGE